jgi:hypothetical protein
MTSETKTTIEPADIQAVELECTKCGFRATWSLDRWLKDDGRCANCGESWPMQRAGAFQGLFQLVKALVDLGKLKDDKDIPFRIRFELIKPIEKAKP